MINLLLLINRCIGNMMNKSDNIKDLIISFKNYSNLDAAMSILESIDSNLERAYVLIEIIKNSVLDIESKSKLIKFMKEKGIDWFVINPLIKEMIKYNSLKDEERDLLIKETDNIGRAYALVGIIKNSVLDIESKTRLIRSIKERKIDWFSINSKIEKMFENNSLEDKDRDLLIVETDEIGRTYALVGIIKNNKLTEDQIFNLIKKMSILGVDWVIFNAKVKPVFKNYFLGLKARKLLTDNLDSEARSYALNFLLNSDKISQEEKKEAIDEINIHNLNWSILDECVELIFENINLNYSKSIEIFEKISKDIRLFAWIGLFRNKIMDFEIIIELIKYIKKKHIDQSVINQNAEIIFSNYILPFEERGLLINELDASGKAKALKGLLKNIEISDDDKIKLINYIKEGEVDWSIINNDAESIFRSCILSFEGLCLLIDELDASGKAKALIGLLENKKISDDDKIALLNYIKEGEAEWSIVNNNAERILERCTLPFEGLCLLIDELDASGKAKALKGLLGNSKISDDDKIALLNYINYIEEVEEEEVNWSIINYNAERIFGICALSFEVMNLLINELDANGKAKALMGLLENIKIVDDDKIKLIRDIKIKEVNWRIINSDVKSIFKGCILSFEGLCLLIDELDANRKAKALIGLLENSKIADDDKITLLNYINYIEEVEEEEVDWSIINSNAGSIFKGCILSFESICLLIKELDADGKAKALIGLLENVKISDDDKIALINYIKEEVNWSIINSNAERIYGFFTLSFESICLLIKELDADGKAKALIGLLENVKILDDDKIKLINYIKEELDWFISNSDAESIFRSHSLPFKSICLLINELDADGKAKALVGLLENIKISDDDKIKLINYIKKEVNWSIINSNAERIFRNHSLPFKSICLLIDELDPNGKARALIGLLENVKISDDDKIKLINYIKEKHINWSIINNDNGSISNSDAESIFALSFLSFEVLELLIDELDPNGKARALIGLLGNKNIENDDKIKLINYIKKEVNWSIINSNTERIYGFFTLSFEGICLLIKELDADGKATALVGLLENIKISDDDKIKLINYIKKEVNWSIINSNAERIFRNHSLPFKSIYLLIDELDADGKATALIGLLENLKISDDDKIALIRDIKIKEVNWHIINSNAEKIFWFFLLSSEVLELLIDELDADGKAKALVGLLENAKISDDDKIKLINYIKEKNQSDL